MAKDGEKRKKDGSGRLIFGIIAFLVIAVGAFFGYRFGRAVFSDTPKTPNVAEAKEYEITILERQSTMSVGRELERNGIIDSAFVFYIQTRLYKCVIQPGTYTFRSSMSSKAIAKSLNAAYEQAHKGKKNE